MDRDGISTFTLTFDSEIFLTGAVWSLTGALSVTVFLAGWGTVDVGT